MQRLFQNTGAHARQGCAMRQLLRIGCLTFVLTWGWWVPAHAQSLTGIAVPEEGAGDGAGAGDLRFNVECLFEVSGEGFLWGDFYLRVANNVVSYYPFEGWVQDGQLINYSAIVPAANSNRNIDCEGSTNVGYFQSPTIGTRGLRSPESGV